MPTNLSIKRLFQSYVWIDTKSKNGMFPAFGTGQGPGHEGRQARDDQLVECQRMEVEPAVLEVPRPQPVVRNQCLYFQLIQSQTAVSLDRIHAKLSPSRKAGYPR